MTKSSHARSHYTRFPRLLWVGAHVENKKEHMVQTMIVRHVVAEGSACVKCVQPVSLLYLGA